MLTQYIITFYKYWFSFPPNVYVSILIKSLTNEMHLKSNNKCNKHYNLTFTHQTWIMILNYITL